MSKIKGGQRRKIRFTIDGKEVEAMEGWTVLDTARQNGVHIPTLCFHEAVKTSGACRLCVVEAKQGGGSKVVISCMYPPSEGLEVLTRSERVMNVRRWILEMLLAECPASKEIRALAEEYGVKKTRFKIENPEEQCLLCGLCVRACEEVVGVRAISFGSRGVTKKINTPYMIPNKACIACGSCVTICPTGAMQARLDAVRGDVSERTGKGFAH
jgi:NADH dehydrogenase/NADH:ubiquinone oxidoreductase subunit G